MEKVLQELFRHVILSAHAVQTIPKCIWTDLSTWENCSPWDFYHNSIQNIIILADVVENSLLSKENLPLVTL